MFLLPGYFLGYIWRGPSLWFDDLAVLPLEESSRDGVLLSHVSSLHDVEQRGQVDALLGGRVEGVVPDVHEGISLIRHHLSLVTSVHTRPIKLNRQVSFAYI